VLEIVQKWFLEQLGYQFESQVGLQLLKELESFDKFFVVVSETLLDVDFDLVIQNSGQLLAHP